MSKRNRQQVQDRRQEKKEGRSKKDIQPQKFQEERKARVVPLSAKNIHQKEALLAFAEKQLICLSGSAGSGKTTLAVWWACKQFLEGKIDNIIFTRGEKGLGATPPVPGNDVEKMLLLCLPMLLKAKSFIGAGALKNNLCLQDMDFLFSEVKGFMVFPMAKLGGMSFDERTIIIADEQQAATIPQIKALSTRAEEGCQVILTGDTTQSPVRGAENGLQYLERTLMANPHELAQVVKFTPDDNCRKGITAHLTRIFEQDGQW